MKLRVRRLNAGHGPVMGKNAGWEFCVIEADENVPLRPMNSEEVPDDTPLSDWAPEQPESTTPPAGGKGGK